MRFPIRNCMSFARDGALGMAGAYTFDAGNGWYLQGRGLKWLAPTRFKLGVTPACTFEAGNDCYLHI